VTGFVYRRTFAIEWGHCDPAGIVFNSRFFEFFDRSAWLMFEAALGVAPHELSREGKSRPKAWRSGYGRHAIPMTRRA
jgi:acyl-CoA thioesterase FadM